MRDVRNTGGFSLIEILVAMAIFGICVSLATMGWSAAKSYRVKTAAQELYSDLQGLRVRAMTESTSNSRGFGIRFVSSHSYELFEFVDTNSNFQYDGLSEEADVRERDLPSSIAVKKNASPSTVAGDIYLYDHRGFLRDTNWGTPAGGTYILSGTGAGQARCVTIAQVRIREGNWNGTDCDIH